MKNTDLFTTYEVVFEDLKNKISNKTYSPGEKLPSFSELCELYNVSNITIRKSVELLRQNGYIHSVPRVGNFVNEVKDEMYTLQYNSGISLKHKPTRVEIVSLKSVDKKVAMEEALSHHLENISEDFKAAQIIRKHYCGEMPVMYERIYILHHRKLNVERLKNTRWVDAMVDVIENYDINKKINISIENNGELIKGELFLTEEDSIFKINMEYYTKRNQFSGFLNAYISCEDIKLKIV